MTKINKRKPVNGMGSYIVVVLIISTLMVVSFGSYSSVYAAASVGGFPRTVTVDGQSVVIPHKPMRIAAISGDGADIVLELVDTERIAVIPFHQDNPVMYRNSEKAKEVKSRIVGAVMLDPEAVLAHDPDLIVLTLTHGAETDALNLLALSGIPIIAIRDWSGFDALKANIMLLGQAVGEEEVAGGIVQDMDQRLKAISARLDGVERRRALPLSVVSPEGTTPYLIGPTSFKYDLLVKAGAVSAGDSLGVTRSTLASMEQLIQADPDYLLLSDWFGTGLEAYREFLSHPGMQAVSAVASDNVLALPYRELWHTLDAVDGVEKVAAWLYPEHF